MSTRRGLLTALVLAAALGACGGKAYVSVVVSLGKTYQAQVDQLSVFVADAANADAGPVLMPKAPLAHGMPDASVIVVVEAPSGSEVSVVVEGFGADGGIVAAGGAQTPSRLKQGITSLEVDLSPPCTSNRACDPAGVCAGTTSCNQAFGACVPVAPAVALDAGSACGPGPIGQCDGNGNCLLPYCGTGLQPPPPGEQCDDGDGPGGGNSDTLPDHCRTNCQFPHCGDGVLDPDAGEICDFDAGNNGLGLGCNATCNLFGNVTTLAGSGDAGFADNPQGNLALFAQPVGLAVIGASLYVADTSYDAVRIVDLSAPYAVTTLAGGVTGCIDRNGTGDAGSFCNIRVLAPYDGGLLASDDGALRFITLQGVVTTFAGQLAVSGTPPTGVSGGPLSSALYGIPFGIATDGPLVYTDTDDDGAVLLTDPGEDLVTVLAQVGTGTQAQNFGGLALVGGQLYVVEPTATRSLLQLDPASGTQTTLPYEIQNPNGMCTDGRSLYVCAGNLLQQVDLDGGTLSLLAGGASGGAAIEHDGLGTQAGFSAPASCTWDPSRHVLYVSDQKGNVIRQIQ